MSNTIRGYAAEFVLTTAKGLDKIEPLLARIAVAAELPRLAQELFASYGKEYAQLKVQIQKIEAKLMGEIDGHFRLRDHPSDELAFITGHLSSFQAATAASSRSAAWRAGTCTLHPIRCSSTSSPASV